MEIMKSAPVTPEHPGSGRQYGVRRGGCGDGIMSVDAFMATQERRFPRSSKLDPKHRRRWNTWVAGCRPPFPKFLDTSPSQDLFIRACHEHKAQLNEDLDCPQGHVCNIWDVVEVKTGKVWDVGRVEERG